MKSNYEKFRDLLKELFQIDRADLDFGIYRIMNQKRDEILAFLDNDLLPQIKGTLTKYEDSDRAAINEELEKTIEQARKLGADPETLPKVKELQELLSQTLDITALENEVFSHLYNFFNRYYDNGDFISKRRYKEGVYAIPYEGEEVKLYWANHDQYYVKTSEYLRDYTFKLPSGKRVHFKLVEADTEKDNIKEESGKERRFILSSEEPFKEENGELFIQFFYTPSPDNKKQATLNEEAKDVLFSEGKISRNWSKLASLAPTEKNPNRTLLEKHLTEYTARNTFDYFIHKNLGGFLRRELDFYIKNEIMHLDDIENDKAPGVEQYLSKIKAIRKIAHKIIQFLAQIEDFQKKLWLKKKFVIETNYCVTLDRVPEELYPEIAENGAQRQEWVRLFAIDEIKGDLAGSVDYSEPLTVDFLKTNTYLVLDTKYFTKEFKLNLLSSFYRIDDLSNGLLIHSENFNALHFLNANYRNKIKCIYIDPPYNTGADGFLYKDTYQHSSWVGMLYSRLFCGKQLLKKDGLHLVSIGDDEFDNTSLLLSYIFSNKNIPFIWKSRAKPTNAGDAIYKPQIVAEFVMMNLSNSNIEFFPLKSGQERIYPHKDKYVWRQLFFLSATIIFPVF